MKLPLISTLHVVFLISILLFHFAMSSNLIEDSCKKAADKDPNLNYEFCVQFLQETPMSQNATLRGLVIISTKQAIHNATSIRTRVFELLNEKNFNNHTKAALRDCLELYSDAKSSLRDALEDIKLIDFHKANIDLSAALDAPGTCEDGLHEDEPKSGGDGASLLTMENNIFFQITVIPLAFLNMLS